MKLIGNNNWNFFLFTGSTFACLFEDMYNSVQIFYATFFLDFE